MADVRLLIREEGRTARNLVAFNVPVGTNNIERVTRKPPSVPRVISSTNMKRNIKTSARVRSASTGRDKKSELQARYWAFLFGNLQRAVDGIYQTCEEDENISECKEVILVLENYTRDFHNLIEWFKVKWAYENSPPPLRQAPLAWEVRKTSPCRMWNSSVAKCSSPTQRLSPTCQSPDDQGENRTASNAEKLLNSIRDACDYKRIKDNKNVSRKDPNNLKDRRRNSVERESDRIMCRESSTVGRVVGRSFARSATSVKLNGNVNNKKSNEIINRDAKNTSVNKENKNNETGALKRIHSLADIERIKNKTNGTLTELSRVENDRVTIVDNKNINRNMSNNSARPRSTPNPSRPYAAVSQSQKSSNQLPEAPKMVRSKTSLNVREVSSVSKARPGSSVMVRRRLQRLRNDRQLEESSDISGSVEVLSKQTAKSRKSSEDSDGWQTVRGRCRRGSSHSLSMSTRFHRPTTATSLPALSIESPNEKKKKNLFSVSCPTPNKDLNVEKMSMIKFDDRGKNMITINGKHKSFDDESKKENVVPNVACDTNSTSVIAAIFKSEAELLEKRIQQFMTAQAERERIILEEERKTEEADSKRSQQLSDEEASLQRQIQELESTEIDVDTETDETDGEMMLEIEEGEIPETINEVVDDISLEDRYENMLEGMSWAERVDTLAQLKALVARHPGRALELHQKLSSPSRKRSLPETLRRYQAKQACAQHKRLKLLSEKSQRLRELLNKVEDVKRAKNQLTEDKRLRMEMKLKRAEENRTQHLLEVVRKAHDEDSKLKEIAFINELEAQNKRHDFMALCQEQEERIQGIHEERQRRQEEKAAKEAAAEERRRALEAERLLRIQKMRQTRREREERVGKMQLEREKERLELAREKARDREERLSALHAAQLANQEELQKKIAQKQQESARRHGENIEHIRQRAVELSILRMEEIPPTLKCYPAPKQCSLCNTQILNEVCLVSHLKSKHHLDAVKKVHDGKELSRDDLHKFNITQIKDVQVSSAVADDKAAKEKQRALKRRSRKLKQRMTARGQEWKNSQTGENGQNIESSNKTKLRRNLKELDRLCSSHGKTTWSSVAVAGLERCLGEIGRVFSKTSSVDQDVFQSLNGFETLTNLLNLGVNIQNNSHTLSNKSIMSICRVYKASVNDHSDNIEAVLLSNKILTILDLILQRFEAVASLDDAAQTQESTTNTSNASVATAAIQLLCSLVPEVPSNKSIVQSRLHDIIGFLVTGGLVDRVTRHNRALIESDYLLDQEHESPLLLASYDLLHRLTCHLKRVNSNNDNSNSVNHESEQSTAESHLLGCLETTEAAGAIGCLYATFALAHQKCASPTPGQTSCSSSSAKLLASRTLKLLKSIAQVDLQTLQKLLGAEGTSLQWRLIASHLITRFLREEPLEEINETSKATQSSPTAVHILTELFTVLGYFAVNNTDNQLVLQTAGAGSSVLQQLCTLPFPFYGDPRLALFTLPTLLAATHKNPEATAVLSCEMSYQLLEEYRDSKEGKLHPLIRLMKDTHTA
ncbi:S phase cyclin A-associated protein in the endoplasmic reticulum [Microplitis demolitor]|uniref:S phase cyclin A-associated protein in the endoplasmic reticulum n=1 Tax=Microplitis demolitor TaxID=69319 RepID=UPI0004CDBDAE|nr:S phase cyclin A-associated protein in the endoplasmic reticulum [Microplitis demolitor]XP_014299593.1 S phase cyclin A-associated protein in the endoplasmic reticulum [Microplitis demolitor]XP_014299594.1 S phase cyclin A-associated protein in the endoplasmic reticulum [Microplitis demolitor]